MDLEGKAVTVRSGARVIVDALQRCGIRHVFGVPGESFLGFLDEVRDSPVRFVNCRCEGGAAMMAEAAGKVGGGKPGVAYVTRAPGATNASAGVFVAHQDATPMVLFVGQADSGFLGRGAFQEMDYKAFFGGCAKLVMEPEHAGQLAVMADLALGYAMSGRPGPVVVSVPEDVLGEHTTAPELGLGEPARPRTGKAVAARVAKMAAEAKRPMIIFGGSGWDEESSRRLGEVAERLRAPVAATFRRQGLFDNLHGCYAGDLGIGPNPELLRLVEKSDLHIIINDECSEIPSQGYTLFGIPDPFVTTVHVMPDRKELGRVTRPMLGVCSAPGPFLSALADAIARPKWESRAAVSRVKRAHRSYLEWSEIPPETPATTMAESCARWMRDNLDPETVITNGAGNYSAWMSRHYRFTRFGTLVAPVSGSMGYGLPAAIAVGLEQPGRQAVCLAGDGCLQMTVQELGTAVQEGLSFPVVVFDNGQYGTIRMHQERRHPGREYGVRLSNPDFVALARSYGCDAERVRSKEQFGPAMRRALGAERPCLLHVDTDPDVLAPARPEV